jgi:hypothetical protein
LLGLSRLATDREGGPLASTHVNARPLWRRFIPPPFPPEHAAVASKTWA